MITQSTVASLGLAVGMNLRKAAGENRFVRFTITALDDEGCTLKRRFLGISQASTVVEQRIPLSELVELDVDSAVQEEFVMQIPNALHTWQAACEAWELRVRSAVLKLFQEKHNLTPSLVAIRTQPSQSVFAKTDIAEGRLTLVPFSTSVTIAEAKDEEREGVLNQTCFVEQVGGTHNARTYSLHIKAPKQNLAQSAASSKQVPLVVPFWFVQTTSHPEEVNMELIRHEVDGVPIPVLHNKKAVASGTELFCYKAPQHKRVRDVMSEGAEKDHGEEKPNEPKLDVPVPKRKGKARKGKGKGNA